MSPYVLIIIVSQSYAFTVDFHSRDACQQAQKHLEINVVKVTCEARGEPTPAFKIQPVKSNLHKVHIARRKKILGREKWQGAF